MEWQPIETAPKDGTEFDAWSKFGGRVPNVFWGNPTSSRTTSKCFCVYEYEWHVVPVLDNTLTHWMPLPAPPKQDQTK
ncbi:DUF551 domain-containing protein [Laribacter hongkongensis]|uniref:DUF551 domain-containing protein n=1 Tax=Laribacter hongkongensis TaxID=168471 RepID=UPI003570B9BB